MTDVNDFLADVLPRLHHTETALHSGDPKPRFEMWSHSNPVTVYGAAMNAHGWDEVSGVFEHIASRFSDCKSCEWEVVAAGVSDDLAYIAAIERTTCSVGGSPPSPYALRSPTVFRRENGEWKVAHRHADPIDERAAPLVEALRK